MSHKYKVLQLSAIDITLYKFILPLMQQLREEGFDVIAASRDLGYLQHIEKEGFKTYNITMTRNLNPLKLIKGTLAIYKILKREKVGIIHVHTPIAAMVGRLAAIMAGVKIKIYTVHGFILHNKFYYLAEKFMAKYFTDYIFTVNEEDRLTAIKESFISDSNITNINSVGIDIDKFNPKLFSTNEQNQIRKEIGVTEKDKIVGYVGRIVEEKGVLDLVGAFTVLKQTGNSENLKLLLIGPWDLGERDQDTIGKIRKKIEEQHFEKEILLLGSREDIPLLLSIMDVFVLPSYREGMPVSLLEAMAMEKAVIATDIRGCREEINQETGLLFEPKDITALAEKVDFFLKNPKVADDMGKKARTRVEKHFSQKEVIKKQIDLYKKLTN